MERLAAEIREKPERVIPLMQRAAREI